MNSPQIIILAAGLGKRMKSQRLKVMHEVGGAALIEHSLRLALRLKPSCIAVVVPPHDDSIQAYLKAHGFAGKKVSFVIQSQPLGTGHALLCGLAGLGSVIGPVVVLNADMPFVAPSSVRALLSRQNKNHAAVSLLTTMSSSIKGFGRVLRDKNKKVLGIIEERDATPVQKKTTELSVGIYVFDGRFLKGNISKIKNKNAQKEYYLPDLVAIAAELGLPVVTQPVQADHESLGVNSQADLARASEIFYALQRERLLASGVTILGDAVFVDVDVKVAASTLIEAPCYLKGRTTIGPDCVIKAFCYVTDAKIAGNCHIGPFAHLRPGTNAASGVKIGNFVEIKKSIIGEKSKVNHLTYLGDAKLGKNVNVGAGTITCNYDGFNKFKTILEDGVFVGSDTQLVAPVRVGKGAFVGAGTTVTKDVAADALVVSRVPQREIHGWAARHRLKFTSQNPLLKRGGRGSF